MATASFEQEMPADANLPWRGFKGGLWQKEINVRDFIQQNALAVANLDV